MHQPTSPFTSQAHVVAYGPAPMAAQQPMPAYAPPPPMGSGTAYPPAPPEPPRRRRGAGRVVAGVVGGLAVAGAAAGALFVFAPSTLDTAELADRIATETQQQVDVLPTDVTCPEDVPAEAGDTFTCTAQLDGQPVTYTARQTDDEGNVEFELDDQIVFVDRVEQLLAEQVGADYGVAVTASCDADGHDVLVDGSDTPLPCTVTNVDDAADTLAVVAQVLPDGSVDYAE